VLAGATVLGADTKESILLHQLDRQFGLSMKRLRLPGLAVAAVRDGKVFWAKGYGLANVSRRIPVTPQTPFNIASLTKPMISTLLLQLVEQSKLSLDEPIADFASDVAGTGATIRHVLSMTAESSPPGTAYSYNGNVYASLGKVLEKKAGVSLRELLVTRIFEPLEMTRSVPGLDALPSSSEGAAPLGSERMTRYRAVAADLATPYRLFGCEIVPSLPPPAELNAAANVISTVIDYSRFVSGLAGGRVIREATVAKAWSPKVLADGTRLPYSLGWFVEDYEGERLIWHHGYWPDSYSSLILIVPRVRLALVAMANSDALSAPFYWTEGLEGNVLACDFLRAFVRRSLPCTAVASVAVARWESKLGPPPYRAVAVDSSAFAGYSGTYRTPEGGRIEIVKRNGRLWWRTDRGELYELFPAGGARFFMKAVDYVLTFVSGSDRVVIRVDLETKGQTVSLPRDAPAG